jgi:hypothetical protein
LTTTKKELLVLFKDLGEIEKVWFRSIALDSENPLPHRAKIIK